MIRRWYEDDTKMTSIYVHMRRMVLYVTYVSLSWQDWSLYIRTCNYCNFTALNRWIMPLHTYLVDRSGRGSSAVRDTWRHKRLLWPLPWTPPAGGTSSDQWSQWTVRHETERHSHDSDTRSESGHIEESDKSRESDIFRGSDTLRGRETHWGEWQIEGEWHIEKSDKLRDSDTLRGRVTKRGKVTIEGEWHLEKKHDTRKETYWARVTNWGKVTHWKEWQVEGEWHIETESDKTRKGD